MQKIWAYLLLTSLQCCVFACSIVFIFFTIRMSSYLMCSSLRRDGFSISIGKFQMNAKSLRLVMSVFSLSWGGIKTLQNHKKKKNKKKKKNTDTTDRNSNFMIYLNIVIFVMRITELRDFFFSLSFNIHCLNDADDHLFIFFFCMNSILNWHVKVVPYSCFL